MLSPGNFLRHEKISEAITSHPVVVTVLICLIWSFSGLVGHAPWKSEEAILIGLLSQFNTGNFYFDFINLHSDTAAGPLFYGSALAVIELTSSVLLPHDAARLTMSIWLLSAFIFTGLAGRELWGEAQSWLAPLLLLGTVGLLIKSHQISTAPILISGLAVFFYGLTAAPRLSIKGGLWMGVGFSIIQFGAPAHNTVIPLLTIFFISTINFRYRGLRFAKSLLISTFVVLGLTGIWLLTLYVNDPSFVDYWVYLFSKAITNPFRLPTLDNIVYPISVFPWFTWPTWIFVFWSLWIAGRDGLKRKELQLPLFLWAAITLVLTFTEINKESGLTPILLPFALIGSMAAGRIPRASGNILYWFAVMTAVLFTITAWVYFSASYFGIPRELSEHLLKLQPGYNADNRHLEVIFAGLISTAWFILLFNIKRRPERSVLIWAINLTFGWVITVMLLFDWVDERKTYAPMITSMMMHIDPIHNCVIAQVGPAQRGLIHYYGNIKTTKVYLENDGHSCDYLIYQDRWGAPNDIGLPWSLLWEGGRAGDRSERYRLYKREAG